ncbi:MAG: dihydrolipoyl dehydrogenase [Verrucomicrobia bacterium]|nr:dihydrolipoyl dehydrogenase [Verrucomicrobiota bacterium]
MASFDLIVLGGGPAGYTGAIRAAQLGLNTAIIDKGDVLGGTCLNIGCIPSKALLLSSDHLHFARHKAARHGLIFENVSLDLTQMMKRKDSVVRQLTQGLEFLMKKNKITRLFGIGQVVAPGKVILTKKDGSQEELQGKHVVLATGSVPAELPNILIDRQSVVTSDEALSFAQVPSELVVVGAGAIGLELGSVWSRLGAKVTIIEFLPRIAAFFDPDVTQTLQKALEADGIKFLLETTVTSVALSNGKATVEGMNKAKEKLQLGADKVLIAVGRKPYLEGAVTKDLGLKLTDRGRVAVDERYRTNVPELYAIGDIIEGPMLAHKGEDEGVACIERMAGKAGHVNYDAIPNVIYTNPEVAGVGLTEDLARQKGIAVKIGKFPFVANGRALANDQSQGFVKILADPKTDKLLGAQIIGFGASELIPEAVTVLEFGGSAEDVGKTVHAHPTMSEAVKEAALAVSNQAFSIPPAPPGPRTVAVAPER